MISRKIPAALSRTAFDDYCDEISLNGLVYDPRISLAEQFGACNSIPFFETPCLTITSRSIVEKLEDPSNGT